MSHCIKRHQKITQSAAQASREGKILWNWGRKTLRAQTTLMLRLVMTFNQNISKILDRYLSYSYIVRGIEMRSRG